MRANYEITDENGDRVNRIVATAEYVEAVHSGRHTFIGEAEETLSMTTARIDTPLFLMRFTPAERIAIRTAAKTEPLVEDWYMLVNDPRLAYVEIGDPNLTAAMNMLVQMNLLTQARADEILAT